MTDSHATAVCPKCGRPLAADAPRGLCRKCLLSGILGGGAAPTPASGEGGTGKPWLPRGFGQYELLKEIDRGAMGIVYQARQTQLHRLVAVKVMASGRFAAPDFVQRFRTEAEAVASLDHPNIVPVYEVGECEGQPFFSMKLVEGGSLAARIANQQAPIGQAAAELLMKLSRAVHYAHQRGILHRDIKPGNVLLDAQGEPHLTDFGLAKLVERESTLTRTMALLGTPSYMSPEQARGESKQLTTAVDVYGLGAVFYELLTGQPPFAGGTTMETVRQVLEKEPRRPAAVKPGTDRDLETICLKCLAKEPSRRYGSAEALANDLERWMRHEPILARPIGRLERMAKLVRRHPLAAAFSAVTLLLIGLSVLTLLRANVRVAAAQKTEAALRRQAEHEADAKRRQLIRLSVGTGNRLVEEGQSFAALLWFTQSMRLENGDANREDVHRRRFAAVLRQAPELAQIWFHGSFVESIEFSPNGAKVASSGLDGDARVWDVLAAQAPIAPLAHGEGARGVKFTPDGTRLFAVDALQNLRFWDITTGEPLGAPRPTTANYTEGVHFSPDGRWLAVPTKDGVQLYDAKTDVPGPLLSSPASAVWVHFNADGRHLVARQDRDLHLWTFVAGQWASHQLTHPGMLRGSDFSHDGRAIATTTLRTLFVWNLADGKPARAPIQMNSDLFDCRFSADDRWLATATWDGAVRIFDVESARLVSDPLRHRAGVAQCVFSPDGQQLATASWDHTARLWDPRTGVATSPSLPHGGYVSSVSFSPDGSRLATGGQDETVRLWNLRTNSGTRFNVRHEAGVSGVYYSPDSQRLLSCGHDHRACIWDARTGRLLLSLPKVPQLLIQAGFSPDGKRLFTACADGAARLFDAESGAELVPAMRHTQRLAWVAFSPDGRRLVTASRDGTARVWNTTNGEPVTPLLRHGGALTQATFSPDGRRVLTASDDRTAQLWDSQTGERVGPAMTHVSEVAHAEFSPDGQRLVTACSDRTQLPRVAQIWDVGTGKPIGPPLPHTDGVLWAEFSRNGRYVATGGEDRVAVIWDAATGARLTPAMTHSSYVTEARFSPDGRLLLTVSGAGSDFTARVWECATGEPVTPPLQHSASPLAGVWSPDGRDVAIGTADGSISVWDVSPVNDSLAALQRQAEVLSAHRIEPNSGLLPLTAKEMQARWEAFTAGSSRR
jgi:WD40 repeat protein/tRNA A-37 threonylcarbamoyl transferase component Bud32